MEDGCKKAVVILTQHKEYVKEPMPNNLSRVFKKYPKIGSAITNRHNIYNEQKKFVEQQEKDGNVIVIRPPVPLDCKTLEKSTAKLESIYQLGYRQGMREINRVKEFIK